jgi:hypothetical protein
MKILKNFLKILKNFLKIMNHCSVDWQLIWFSDLEIQNKEREDQ